MVRYRFVRGSVRLDRSLTIRRSSRRLFPESAVVR